MGRVTTEDHVDEPVRKMRLPGWGLKASQEGSGDGCPGGAPRFKRCLGQPFSLCSGIRGHEARFLVWVSPARGDCQGTERGDMWL